MTGTIRNFYASGNTASGFYSFNDSILQDVQQLFILKGGPGTGKSSLMKSIAEQVLDRGYDLELMHSPLDNDSLDGVIIPILGVGIVNGTSPYVIDPKYPGVREEIVHLAEGWNVKRLRENRGRVIQLTDQITDTLTKAYEHFGQAKEIHLEREDVYLKGMNFEKANQVTSELYESLFSGEQCENEESLVTNGKEKHMFFGAATPRGVVHFIDNLTEIVDKRIIVKGRPGSGKSTMLKKLCRKQRN
ncbi:hypothetical protein [Caldalkalibacillus mannanilyticus]|uniref:hypothetical protein n=1 Tax=Caldalkalibacillus mannanilyticus TaxID=1418 RepID=UPI0006856AA1|nr:hypothetical protein [Caldalkalibacillus mannanilyticus]